MSFSVTTPDLFEYASKKQEICGEKRRVSKKTRQLLIPYAIRNGTLVHVSEVESGKHDDCLCAGCGEGLVARKGNQVAHHFAHGSESTCKGETVLHKVAKLIVAEKIKKCLQEKRSLPIEWACDCCYDFHEGNLVKVVAGVEIEKSLGTARPDILLTDGHGTPRVAVEIVVTHPPEPSTVEFYRANKITMVTIEVEALEDLDELRRDGRFGMFTVGVDACTRKKCPRCRKVLWDRRLAVIHSHCPKCRNPMRVATVEVELGTLTRFHHPYGEAGGIDFCDKQILENAGVRLHQGRYGLLNVCRSCNHPSYPESFRRHHKWKTVRRHLPSGLCCDSCHGVFSDPTHSSSRPRALDRLGNRRIPSLEREKERSAEVEINRSPSRIGNSTSATVQNGLLWDKFSLANPQPK